MKLMLLLLALVAMTFGVACDAETSPNPDPTPSPDVVENDTHTPAKCDGSTCEPDATEPEDTTEPDSTEPEGCEYPLDLMDNKGLLQCGGVRCTLELSDDHCSALCGSAFSDYAPIGAVRTFCTPVDKL